MSSRLRIFMLFIGFFTRGESAVGRASLTSEEGEGLTCEYFNSTCYEDRNSLPEDCSGVQRCSHGNTCYTVWNNVTGDRHRSGYRVKMMGCFPASKSSMKDCGKDCVQSGPENSVGSPGSRRSGHLFCCCLTDMCNGDFTWDPKPVFPSYSDDYPSSSNASLFPIPSNLPISAHRNASLFLLLYIMIPIFVIGALIVAGLVVYRQRKDNEFNSLSTASDGESPDRVPTTPPLSNRCIELIEIKARGRFGAVWKGVHNNKFVAVKIFPLQDKQSWYAEQAIYNLPRMNHDNILQFLGVERKGESLSQEFWLTTMFHENGSLCDYLKSNVVTWEILCRISHSMARGLTHLHEEILEPKHSNLGMKPAIAHRDFKSKNVLLKSDMTACIGDFGLALVFEPGKSCGDTHGQVGTRRYMAPEVLEGAINFSRDAFLRIDMYACGLVLWELVSRLKSNTITPEDYKLPFEAEANHPSLEEMQDLVCNRKVRPKILNIWRQHPGLNALCDTIEECWDHDAEARLSASCVTERIKAIQGFSMMQPMDQHTIHHDSSHLTTPFISSSFKPEDSSNC